MGVDKAHPQSASIKVLVTGASGFVGQILCDRLSDAEVCTSEGVDIRLPEQLASLMSHGSFDWVIHLAAQSFVPESFRDPRATYEVNFLGTLNLLEALQANQFSGRFLYVGTGDAYGLVPESALPVTESLALKPRNPYAVSKAAAEALCYQWSQTSDFDVLMARPFNHIGPGQSERFAISDFAKQIVEVKKGLRPPVLQVGDIDASRDFTDVEDVIEAYFALLKNGHAGEVYNVCSGNEFTIRSLIERMSAIVGKDIAVEIDPSRFRRSEQRRVWGSSQKLRNDSGWQPTTSIDDSLKRILNYWESQ